MDERERQKILAVFDQFEEELRADIQKSYGSSDMGREAVDALLDALLERSTAVASSKPLSSYSSNDFNTKVSPEVLDTTMRYMEKNMRKLVKVIRGHGRYISDGSYEISMRELRRVAPEFESLDGTVETAIENGIMQKSNGTARSSSEIGEDDNLVLLTPQVPQGTYTLEQVRKSTRGRRHRRRIAQEQPQQQESQDRSFSFSTSIQGKQNASSTIARARPESVYTGANVVKDMHKRTFGREDARDALKSSEVKMRHKKSPHKTNDTRRNTISISSNSAQPVDAMDMWHDYSKTVNDAKGIHLEDAMSTLYNAISLRDVIAVDDTEMSRYDTLVWGEKKENNNNTNKTSNKKTLIGDNVSDTIVSTRHPNTNLESRPELNVDWMMFKTPELTNFLRILEAEELLHERQIRSIYNAKKIRMEQQLRRIRDNEDNEEEHQEEIYKHSSEEDGEYDSDGFDDGTMVIKKSVAEGSTKDAGFMPPFSKTNTTSTRSEDANSFSRQRSSRVITNTEGKLIAKKSAARRESRDRNAVDDLISSLSHLNTKDNDHITAPPNNRQTVLIDDLLKKDAAKGKAVTRWMKGQLAELIDVIVSVGKKTMLGTEMAQKGAPTASVNDIVAEGNKRGKMENIAGLLETAREQGIVFFDHNEELTDLEKQADMKVTLLRTSISLNDHGTTLTMDNVKRSVRRKKNRQVVETEV
eukprot:m.86501 g.86501  ORF g.86501 m.86501 type:complete len:699 (+) comp12217_c0_seq1:28-2124(+)